MILTRAVSNKLMMSIYAFSGHAGLSPKSPSRFSKFRRQPVFIGLVLALVATATNAATINYGNFNVPSAGIMFQDVKESSGTDALPLYGPPQPFVIGLDFDPTSFAASATGGASDITDGQLNFTLMGLSNPNGYIGIGSFNVYEAGDYTLVGTGTAATSAYAGAIVRATVVEINGLPVAPINLPPANASVGFNLAGSPGIVQPWSLGLAFNLTGVLPQGQTATKVEVSINNSLIAISEPASVSFIAKKDFRIDLTPTPPVGDPFVPEPATLAMIAIGTVLAVVSRKSRG